MTLQIEEDEDGLDLTETEQLLLSLLADSDEGLAYFKKDWLRCSADVTRLECQLDGARAKLTFHKFLVLTLLVSVAALVGVLL